MVLTALLLILKLTTVFVDPEDALKRDDQTLATCAVEALTARPSDLTIAKSKEAAAVTLTVGNHSGKRIHVIGKLTAKDGTVLIDVNHVTHGFNHSLCHQMDGLLDEMTKKLAAKQHIASQK
jgi:hypothetical protein